MAVRTSEQDVREIIDVQTSINVTPFIKAASALVDRVNSCDSDGLLTTAMLGEIERWLAAHFVAVRDQVLSQEATADASGVYQTGVKGTGSLDTTDYGRQAMTLDFTGCLATLNDQARKGKRTASAVWMGKAPSDQTKYEDRD